MGFRRVTVGHILWDGPYVAVVGSNTAWLPNGWLKFEDFTDGVSNTILVIEVSDSGIDWMQPDDMGLEQLLTSINATPNRSIPSQYYPGVHVLYGDGSIRCLPADLPEETLRALLTIDDGEPIDQNAY